MSDIIEENQQNNDESIQDNENKMPVEEEQKEEVKPFVVSSCKIDGNMQREFSRPLLIYSRIAMIVGLPIVIAYIVLSVLRDEGVLPAIPNTVLYIMLFLGAVLFATGIVFYLSVKKNIKNADNINQTNEYSFYEDYVTMESIRLGERLGATKAYYTDFVKVKESKNYFLLYPTSVSVYPVPKRGLSENDVAHLRNVLRIIKK